MTTPPPTEQPHPYEGVRPKNLLCPHCGYKPSGMPIVLGGIMCPECGHRVSFELQRPVVSKRVRLLTRLFTVVGALVLLGLGMVLWSAAGGKAAILFLGTVLLVLAVLVMLRAVLTRD